MPYFVCIAVTINKGLGMTANQAKQALRKAFDSGKLVARQTRSDAKSTLGEWKPAGRLFDRGNFKAGSYWKITSIDESTFKMSVSFADFELKINK
jgi:hypothetical protein